MASEILKLTSEIVVSHAYMTELTPDQLVSEIKDVYNVLSSLDGGATLEEPVEAKSGAETVKNPPIPLKDIVKTKYVDCLECGKKLKTLKTHLRKAHNLKPKEYFQRFGLDPKKYPLVCREYSSSVAKWLRTGDLGRREVDVRAPRQRKGPSKVILCSVEGPIVVPFFYLAFAGKRGDMLWKG